MNFFTQKKQIKGGESLTQVFSVPSMHCSACAMLLEGLEDDVPGIRKVEASYKAQQIEVEYDPSQVSVEKIIEAVKQEGYEAIPN